jgi:hypothetical protein
MADVRFAGNPFLPVWNAAMTPRRKRSRTGNASSIPFPTPKLSDWLTDSDLYQPPMPPSDEPFQPGEYVRTGFCGTCCRDIQAIQPGGLNPRHIHDQSPLCSEKQKKV